MVLRLTPVLDASLATVQLLEARTVTTARRSEKVELLTRLAVSGHALGAARLEALIGNVTPAPTLVTLKGSVHALALFPGGSFQPTLTHTLPFNDQSW